MTPLQTLYDFYLNDVRGCTFTLGLRALRMAAQDFCERTRAWKVKLPVQLAVAGQSDYLFAPDADMRIVRTISATIDGRDAPLLMPEQAGPGAHGILVHDERSFTVYPALAAGQKIVFLCAVKPSHTASSIDDALFDRYGRAIGIGAKAELYGMKQQPFSDMDAALDERGRFEVEIMKAITNVGRASNSAPIRVKANMM
jgi:hypothetical protein